MPKKSYDPDSIQYHLINLAIFISSLLGRHYWRKFKNQLGIIFSLNIVAIPVFYAMAIKRK